MLQLTEESITMPEKHKSEGGTSDLLVGPTETDGRVVTSILSGPTNLHNRGFGMSVSLQGFIKLQRSEEVEHLIATDPNAFIILTTVAYKAKRTDSFSSIGLKKGEAILSNSDFPGMSRQQYRATIAKLFSCHFLTIKTTNKGTIAKLVDSRVYDINLEFNNQQSNHPTTNKQPTSLIYKDKKNERMKEEVSNDTITRTVSRPRQKDALKFCFEKGCFEGIADSDRADWSMAYPAIKLDQEIAKAVQWVKSNPTKTQSKKLWRKFLTGWFARANDQAVNKSAYSQNSQFSKMKSQRPIEEGDLKLKADRVMGGAA